MPKAPVGDGVVDVLDGCNVPDENSEDAEHDAPEERRHERQGEQQPRRDRPIEAGDDEPPQGGLRPHRRADGARNLLRRPLRDGLGARVPAGGQVGERSRHECNKEVYEKGHCRKLPKW